MVGKNSKRGVWINNAQSPRLVPNYNTVPLAPAITLKVVFIKINPASTVHPNSLPMAKK